MGKVKIYGDINSGEIFFEGSVVEPKALGTVEASLKSDEDRIVIVRNDKFKSDGVTKRPLFKRMNPTRVKNKDGELLVATLGYSTAQVITYINEQANLVGSTGTSTAISTTAFDFKLDVRNNTILVSTGDYFNVNGIKAVLANDNTLTLRSEYGSKDYYVNINLANVTINSAALTGTNANKINQLNALFAQSGTSTGDLPVITSSTTVTMTKGDTLNYELTATNGVGYEWTGLPSGITQVNGNLRKLIGGASLAAGTYTFTAKAINYNGADTETITLTVNEPAFANTKSILCEQSDYLGANAAVYPEFERSGNGSGSSDAWSIALWYKANTNNNGQVIFYYGGNDTVNEGHFELRQTNLNNDTGDHKRLRLRYGRNTNYIQMSTPADSLVAGTWKHILVTYDGGTTGVASGSVSDYYSRFKIYIDGTLQTTSDSHNNYGYNGGITGENCRIGKLVSGNTLRGAKVDEFAIWDKDVSSNIANIYNSGDAHDLMLLGTNNTPIKWFRMGDGENDSYPNIRNSADASDTTSVMVMYNQTSANIVTDAPAP
tara:strand:+ start:1858 stop:3498 length:1641 start_codon:yes stop_codon:yes gene_type:complete